jgi:hypothetical protein
LIGRADASISRRAARNLRFASAIAERFVSDLFEDSLVQSVQSAENSDDRTGQLSLRLDF